MQQLNTAWVVINDLKGLLIKFAKKMDPAKESKTTHQMNFKLIPFYLGLVANQLSPAQS